MHPLLLSLGPLNIYSYGAMLAVGVILGTWLNCRLARDNGLTPDRVQSATVWIMLAAIVGTRVFYVFIELDEFVSNPMRVFYIWEGGMVFYGGLIGGLLASLILARRWKISLLRLFDSLVPGLALGQACGRVGCFLAGCCFGIHWDGACAVVFTDPGSLAPRGVSLFPSQLFEAGAMLLVCLALLWFWRRRGPLPGRVLCLFGILAGLERIIAEQVRGDWRGTPLGNDIFTPTIIIAIIMLVVCAWGFWQISRRRALKKNK